MPQAVSLIKPWAQRLEMLQFVAEDHGLREFAPFCRCWFVSGSQARKIAKNSHRLQIKHQRFLDRFWPGHGSWLDEEDIIEAMLQAMVNYHIVLRRKICYATALASA